jgi:ANTAR domain/GAF domain
VAVLSAPRVAEVFVEIADTLVDDFDVIEFLRMVTGRIAELVDGAAVGLLLADPSGQLQFMGASDEASWMLRLFEFQKYEGPSLEAFRTGEPVECLNLRETIDRWPVFGRRAVVLGFGCAHAIPMRLRGQVIGALNLLGQESFVMEAADQAVVQALADVATIGLLQERQIRRGAAFADQLQTALDNRIAIEQAKGALAQAHGVSVDEAFAMLLDHARSRGHRLSELAAAVIAQGRASVAQLAEAGLRPTGSGVVV